MGGQDERDRQALQHGLGPALARRVPKRPAQGRPLRGPTRRPGLSAARPNLRPLLGEVDELEVQAEGSDDGLEGRGIDRRDIQREPRRPVAAAGRDRPLAGRFDEVERVRARLLDDHLAEQRAEESHLALEHVA